MLPSKQRRTGGLESRNVAGWNQVLHGRADDLLTAISEHLTPGIIDLSKTAIEVRDEDAIRGLLNQIAQAFLALCQRPLRGGSGGVETIKRTSRREEQADGDGCPNHSHQGRGERLSVERSSVSKVHQQPQQWNGKRSDQ